MQKQNYFENEVNFENLYNTMQAITCQEKTLQITMSYVICKPNHKILSKIIKFKIFTFFWFGMFAVNILEEYNTNYNISYLLLVYSKKLGEHKKFSKTLILLSDFS